MIEIEAKLIKNLDSLLALFIFFRLYSWSQEGMTVNNIIVIAKVIPGRSPENKSAILFHMVAGGIDIY